ncbi:PKD domain-containing protein [Methanobacterium alcaliphilum]|uniref:PKD domain-containing protein n=1 Tax=Methanobacterium alcaliphilum TaxID=392018 RepID=UPI002009EA1E|nr:PKD domain-containing protein [Methanobacterium alcaliphilum]MCK9150353.1 PKD domain-containing protein [Methanobacterium alcaliphilum]
MKNRSRMFRSIIISLILLASLFAYSNFSMPSADAHILVVGSPSSDLPADYLTDAKNIAAKLKKKYGSSNIVTLYGKQATAKNILMGMYNADMIIYIGHGGYMDGRYNGKGGIAKPPFSLVGYAGASKSGNEFIWGIGDKMREGWYGNTFNAPLKQNSAVMLFHVCFSTGWVEDYTVANPVETINNFAKMFGSGVNYYASAWFDSEIIDTLVPGGTFNSANHNIRHAAEKLTKIYTAPDGTSVRRSSDGAVSFVGNFYGKFPTVSQITKYNSYAALAWYNGDRQKFLVSAIHTNPEQYMNQTFTIKEYSADIGSRIVNYTWDFGDGITAEYTSPKDVTHSYSSFKKYTVKHTVTNNLGQIATSTKTITVVNRAPVANFKTSAVNYAPKKIINFTSYAYDQDKGDNVTSIYWNLGDGATSNESHVKHRYSKEGTYKVSLTAVDTYGKKGTKYKILKIYYPKPDLVITKAKKSGKYLKVTVKNKGNKNAKKFKVKAWNGKYSKIKSISGLKAGKSKSFQVRFSYSHGKVKADSYNKVKESNEKNNVRKF